MTTDRSSSLVSLLAAARADLAIRTDAPCTAGTGEIGEVMVMAPPYPAIRLR
jgi:hypothetical protein